MAADFDPYHVWLGIPPEEQPANHYRLLGLKLFESSADVIDNAADRQMAHVRTIQTGKHGDLSQRLLNELSAARVCLLDPKKRAAYDQQLRAKLAAAAAAVAPAGAPIAPGGSGIQRQPPRRMPVASPMQPQAAPAAALSQAAAAPQPADVWDDLLGDPSGKSAAKPGGKSAKAAAAKRDSKNRVVAYGIAAAVAVAAAIGIGIFATVGSSPTTGTLVFDLPAANRSETTVAVDNHPITLSSDGRWDCPPGTHHIVGQRAAYKFAADVTVVAGQNQNIAPDWRPKAVLVLNLPPELRSGELKIDGRVQTVTQQMPLQIAVEPGKHFIQITRPGAPPIGTTASVEADGRQLVAIAPPPTTATLLLDWPAGERKGAELTVDGHSRAIDSVSDANPLELTVPPGKHVVRIARTGFESFRQAVELSAGANQAIKPTWTPEQKAPAVAETAPVETAPQPVKKLAPPSAAEIERIVTQVDSLYKTSGVGAKDPAKAQQLYDVAAKDGSSPAERYVLLMKGAEIAAVGGDLNLALSGIDTLDEGYQIDAFVLKQKLLDKFIGIAKPDQAAAAIPVAEQLVDQAVAADQYEAALVLATAASRAAVRSQLPVRQQIEDRLARRRHDIRIIEPIYAAAKKAQEVLDKNPADPEADLAVGRWRCFYKNDWATGLPLLTKSSDEKLKSLAAADLKSPTGAEQQIALADAWWSLAEKEAGTARDTIRLHAGGIYQAALPNLTSALKKAAIEKRLTEIAALQTAAANAASRSATTGKPTAGPKFPLNQWVDVLRLVDTANAVEGKWSRSGDEIDVEAGHHSRIAIPVAVEGSYDLEVEFNRIQGNGEVRLRIPVGSHACDVEWDYEGSDSVLDLLNGQNIESNPTRMTRHDLQNGHNYHLAVKVRLRRADQASVDVLLDGKPFLPHWEGDPAVLAVDGAWQMTPEGHLGLGAWNSHVVFGSARLRMVSGHASVDPVPAESSAPQEVVAPTTAKLPPKKWVDILKLVDTAKSAGAGKWSRTGSEVTCDAQDLTRLAIPIAVDGSNEMEVEFTRTDGDGDVNTIFVVGSHQCMAKFSADEGGSSGLDSVDGRNCQDHNNPTHIDPGTLQNNHRYRLLIKTTVARSGRASVDVVLDGKQYLPHWEGDPASLSVGQAWQSEHPKEPGLEVFKSRVTFHSVRLRMLSGQATVDSDAGR